MRRVVKGASATLTLPVDQPATGGTITITRDRDAQTIVNAASLTVGSSEVTYVLAAQSAEANLSATWSITNASGTVTFKERIEVCSAMTVSVDDIRRLKPLDNANKYSTALIERTRAALENEIEVAAGVSMCGREFTLTIDGSSTNELFLPVGRPRSITSCVVASATYSNDDLANLIVDPRQGVIVNAKKWTAGRMNTTVTGVCGFETPPGQAGFAIAKGVRYMLVDTGSQDRAISVTNEDGTTQNMVVAGLRNSLFAIPELTVLVNQYRQAFGVA